LVNEPIIIAGQKYKRIKFLEVVAEGNKNHPAFQAPLQRRGIIK